MSISLKDIEHFVFVLVAAFVAQIAVGGAAIDITSAAGRSAAVTAIAVAIWRAIRETTTPPSTGS